MFFFIVDYKLNLNYIHISFGKRLNPCQLVEIVKYLWMIQSVSQIRCVFADLVKDMKEKKILEQILEERKE